MKTQDEYVDAVGNRCPQCDSYDLTGQSIDVVGNEAYQEISCNECGATWTDVYVLVRFGDFAPGE